VLAAYDRMTAHELFLRFGLSERLVNDFLKPTLLVGLFKPPEELSALVVMELLYFYALAHQDSFDVRWIRKGTVAESLIAPLAAKLLADSPRSSAKGAKAEKGKRGQLTVVGGAFVTAVEPPAETTEAQARAGAGAQAERAGAVRYVKKNTSSTPGAASEVVLEGVDGVVLALGAKGLKSVVGGSPLLAKHPEFSQAASLSGIDVISTRLWLDKSVATRTPANVFSRFEGLGGAGGTFFMLDQLQGTTPEDRDALWGCQAPEAAEAPEPADADADADADPATSDVEAAAEAAAEPEAAPLPQTRGSVVACDFYNAGGLLSLSDQELVDLLTKELLPAAVPEFGEAQVLDSWVGKYPGAVSWFSPGSYEKRPPLEGAGPTKLPNVKCAGDWVRMGDREHGAKGLCQERAYVSGLEAANSLLAQVARDRREASGPLHPVLPVRPDEPQVVAGQKAAKELLKGARRMWVR